MAQNVIVVIGSSFRSRDARNPFNWEERKAQIQSTLSPTELARVEFLPVRDYYDDDRWNAAVRAGVQALSGGEGAPKLVGFKKDHTSYYLEQFPGWETVDVVRTLDIDATSLRNVFFEGCNPDARLTVLEPFVPPQVLAYLQAWSRLPVYQERAREHLEVVNYRKRYTAPAHLTADALVTASGHVLLIRRGGKIGHGLWAIPGGFVDPNEPSYAAAVRELREETTFHTLPSTMRAALKGKEVFEHPLRSPRGRLVSTAFHFDLGNIRLPEVQPADGELDAKWVPISELSQYIDNLFEDHAAILDRFIGVYD